jgi:hypothetical protein
LHSHPHAAAPARRDVDRLRADSASAVEYMAPACNSTALDGTGAPVRWSVMPSSNHVDAFVCFAGEIK